MPGRTDSWLYVPFLADALGLGAPTTFTPPPWWAVLVAQHRLALIDHGLYGRPFQELQLRGVEDHGQAQASMGFGRYYIAAGTQEEWMDLSPIHDDGGQPGFLDEEGGAQPSVVGQAFGHAVAHWREQVDGARAQHLGNGSSGTVTVAQVGHLDPPQISHG